MADVLNRNTKQLIRSVNTPDYPVSEWIINPDLSAVKSITSEHWVIENDLVRTPTKQEIEALLPAKKAEKERELAHRASEYGQSKFPIESEMRLKLMYQQAVVEGKTNRASYIAQSLQFEQIVIADMMQRIAQVRAAKTLAELNAVSMDYSSHDAATPHVTVAGAIEVQD